MILKGRFLLFLLLCWPITSVAADANALSAKISSASNIEEAAAAYESAFEELAESYNGTVSPELIEQKREEVKNNIAGLTCDANEEQQSEEEDQESDEENQNALEDEEAEKRAEEERRKAAEEEEKRKRLEEKKKAYDAAHENEQSLANRTLTAATTAATGLGAMELAMGLSEQKADKEADANMEAYIATMRCTYGDGKQVKAGPDEIELPGANNEELLKLRKEYIALAADLKERKEALGMKPGIESEEILDKSQMGLYNDEFVGITGGTYSSLYRAKMLGSEVDQAKIDEERKTSKNRVIAGGTMLGTGIVGGVLGNSLINGKLGDLIKGNGGNASGEATSAVLKVEEEALDDIKKCLRKAGAKDVNDLTLESMSPVYPSGFSVENINCSKDLTNVKGVSATALFKFSGDFDDIIEQMVDYFGGVATGKMLGVSMSEDPTDYEKEAAAEAFKDIQEKIMERIAEAYESDEESSSSDSSSGGLLDQAKGLLGGGDGEGSGLLDQAKGLLGGGDGEGSGLMDQAKGLLGGSGGGALSSIGSMFGG